MHKIKTTNKFPRKIIYLASLLLILINIRIEGGVTPKITQFYINSAGNNSANIAVGENFFIQVNGQNQGSSSAPSGGIAIQIRQAITKDNEMSISSILATGSNSDQNTWWKNDLLGNGSTAQYLHVEPTWNNWGSGIYKSMRLTLTAKKAGTYYIYCKMYLNDGAGGFPRDPAGSSSNTDHQNEATYYIGSVTV